MNYYEIPFAVSTEMPTQGIEVLASKIRDMLEKTNGKVFHSEYWGVRDLAYKIEKSTKGRFYLLYIESNGEFPKMLTTYLGLNESVLRYAVFKTTEAAITKEPSEILKKLAENQDYLASEEEKAFSVIFSKLTPKE